MERSLHPSLVVSSILVACSLLLAPVLEACSVPPGGCIASNCARLTNLAPPRFGSGNTQPPVIGRYAGGFNHYWNTTNNSGVEWESVRGGPFINWEVYPNVESQFVIVSAEALLVTKLADCCSLCARTAGCALFQFFTNKNISRVPGIMGLTPTTPPGGAYTSAQQCYLLTGGSVTGTGKGPFGSPFSGPKNLQIGANQLIVPSWVGGSCNPDANVTDDPHFVGAYGTKFDFNGEAGGVFNLISDKDIHVNIKLGGYLDSRTYGATLLKDGKAVRTWIKEIGFIWREAGVTHSAVLSARLGKDNARGSGYLSSLVLDGQPMPVPTGASAPLQVAALSLAYSGVTQQGPYELESYRLTMGNLLDMSLKLRPAHPLLQTADDAYVHFNLHINKFTPTAAVHGVLGQTFRSSGSQYLKALEYQMLVKLLGSPIAADGASGNGFLEGSPKDYEMDTIVSTEGKFSSYM